MVYIVTYCSFIIEMSIDINYSSNQSATFIWRFYQFITVCVKYQQINRLSNPCCFHCRAKQNRASKHEARCSGAAVPSSLFLLCG